MVQGDCCLRTVSLRRRPCSIADRQNFVRPHSSFNISQFLLCLAHFAQELYTLLPCSVYPFKKDQKILQFLDNFNDHNSNDDEMWERSKEIKPSGNR